MPGPMQRVVEAIGSAAGKMGQGIKDDLAERLESAMAKAVLKALEEGVDINDSKEMLRRKQLARDAVLDGHP